MKNASARQAGYTIVETMLFLIITGALLTSALLLFNDRIGRSRFTQAVQTLDTQIKTTINEVSSGNYPNAPTFSCSLDAAGVPEVAAAASNKQGTNTNCIFIGKIIQPGVKDQDSCGSSAALKNCISTNVYTVVGRRTLGSGEVVTSLADPNGAKPRLVNGLGDAGSSIDLTDVDKLPGGMYVTSIKNVETGDLVGAIGIFQSLGAYSDGANSKLNAGSQSFQLWPISNNYPLSKLEVTNAVAASGAFDSTKLNPPKGVIICLQSGSSNQKATITLGFSNSALSTNLVIGENPLCVA